MPALDATLAEASALLDLLQAAELAWHMKQTPHIQTLRGLNHKHLPPNTRALLSRLTAAGADKCRDFCGRAIDTLNGQPHETAN